MERLPNELLSLIYSHLHPKDIINLPFDMTSRVYLSKEHEQDFRIVHSRLENTALLKLLRIATNPSLAGLVKLISISPQRSAFIDPRVFLKQAWKKHVHHPGNPLFYPGCKLPNNLTFENFHELVRVAEPKCSYCHDQSLKTQYDCIEAEYLGWKSWHSRGQDIPLLTLAFSHLSSLQEVHVVDENFQAMRLQVKDRTRGIPSSFFHPHYSKFSIQWPNNDLYDVVVQAVWPLQQVDGVFPSNPPVGKFCPPDATFEILFGNLCVPISVTAEGKISVNDDIGILGLTTTHNMRLVRALLSASSIDTHVYAILKSIPDLHSLKLVSSDDSLDGPSLNSVLLCRLLVCPSCARLSKLDVSGYWISQAAMVKCLKAAAKPLRSLRLHRIAISEGNWAYLFDQLGDQFSLDALSLEAWDSAGKLVEFNEEDVRNALDWMCGRCDFHSLRLMEADWVGY